MSCPATTENDLAAIVRRSSALALALADTVDARRSDPLVGRVLGDRYQLVRLLGRGGMGAVYEAKSVLGRRYAIKVLLDQELADVSPVRARDSIRVARFFREARAAAALDSAHIVQVFDTGRDEALGCPFMVMELLRGEDLHRTVRRLGPLPPVTAARVARQAALGLAHAHRGGVVHRDVKPANVFIAARESGELVVKLVDFGVAKPAVDALADRPGSPLTKTGSMVGTPMYMSPEQAQGLKSVDARTDVWSVAMCLYEALSGAPPFGHLASVGAIIVAVCRREVPRLESRAPWVPKELADVVHRALVRDVELRTPTAAALADALLPFCGGATTLVPELLVAADRHATPNPRPDVATETDSSIAPSRRRPVFSAKLAPPSTLMVKRPAVRFVSGACIAGALSLVSLGFGRSTPPAPSEEAHGESCGRAPEVHAAPARAIARRSYAELTHGELVVDAPHACSVTVDDARAVVVSGKIALSGVIGAHFRVRVSCPSAPVARFDVYLDDAFVVPDVIHVAARPKPVEPNRPRFAEAPLVAPSDSLEWVTGAGERIVIMRTFE